MVIRMKWRLISTAAGLVLLAVVLLFYDTCVLTAALALFSGIVVYEVLVATRHLPSKVGGIFCAIYAGSSLFLLERDKDLYILSLVLFWVVLIACMLALHKRFSFSQLSVCAFTSMAVPLSFSTVLLLRDMENGGLLSLLLACTAAWATDSAAYLTGKTFGKRKLCPGLSPNKTVEGAIGGLAATGLLFPLACLGYQYFISADLKLSFFHALLIGLLCAFSAMMGDLFASAIKRQSGIKDFGKLIPGHGGVTDRFDSFLFAAPTLFFLMRLFPIFTP